MNEHSVMRFKSIALYDIFDCAAWLIGKVVKGKLWPMIVLEWVLEIAFWGTDELEDRQNVIFASKLKYFISFSYHFNFCVSYSSEL